MSELEGVTLAGDPVFRHTPEASVSGPASYNDAYAEAVVKHMSAALGEPNDLIWHEVVSDMVHIDVHFIDPKTGPSRHVLFTTGMSHRPMNVPPGHDIPTLAEVMIVLPGDWPLDEESLRSERYGWPITLLKTLARLPHRYDTWLAVGHTIPNNEPPEPYVAGTGLCCALLLPPIQALPDSKWSIPTDDGQSISLLCVYLIHEAEMVLKMEKGVDALLDPFDAAHVLDIVDLNRKSSVEPPRKKRFGLF
ncbi:MAG: suppressor of fused domain protein [Coriobacteriia bacterium]|nr:suppressor of fused domain protein [Coriobacteriia bacterium]